jgi:hypothetical protein
VFILAAKVRECDECANWKMAKLGNGEKALANQLQSLDLTGVASLSRAID